jgi:hypothetical protein
MIKHDAITKSLPELSIAACVVGTNAQSQSATAISLINSTKFMSHVIFGHNLEYSLLVSKFPAGVPNSYCSMLSAFTSKVRDRRQPLLFSIAG